MDILSINDVLLRINRIQKSKGKKPITLSRMRQIARERHDRFGVGRQVGGDKTWVFSSSEVKHLMPSGKVGRPLGWRKHKDEAVTIVMQQEQ